jgi:acylphosphatase
MKPDTAAEIRRVVFHGQVQGVGFRYSTHRIAQRFDVAGYVKNLRDGTVEAVIAGDPATIDSFLAAVGAHFPSNIDRVESENVEPTERYEGFSIRH